MTDLEQQYLTYLASIEGGESAMFFTSWVREKEKESKTKTSKTSGND